MEAEPNHGVAWTLSSRGGFDIFDIASKKAKTFGCYFLLGLLYTGTHLSASEPFVLSKLFESYTYRNCNRVKLS